jgi:Na+-driven multidrug efflux pump
VGHSLGAKNPDRATRAAYYGYGLGGGFMVVLGLAFALFGRFFAAVFSDDAAIVDQAANCLRVTGFIQCGFAAAIVFGSALRGAGDTVSVMLLNLLSIVGVRCLGVLIVVHLGGGLTQVWYVLCSELMLRGTLVFGRFLTGKWRHVTV